MSSESKFKEESKKFHKDIPTFSAKVIAYDGSKVSVMLNNSDVIKNYVARGGEAEETEEANRPIMRIVDGKSIADSNSESQMFNLTVQQLLGNSFTQEASDNLYKLIKQENGI